MKLRGSRRESCPELKGRIRWIQHFFLGLVLFPNELLNVATVGQLAQLAMQLVKRQLSVRAC